jgi:hypothetical protein
VCERLPAEASGGSAALSRRRAFPGPAGLSEPLTHPRGRHLGTPGEAPGTNWSQSTGSQACREGTVRHILENDDAVHAGEGCS